MAAQAQSAGTMASAFAARPRNSTRLPATLILPAGRRTAGRLLHPAAPVVADGPADGAFGPIARPVGLAPPARLGKYPFGVNIARTVPPTKGRTRHPARSA